MEQRKEYEFFDHTADAKFRAYGRTLEGAFSNAAKAMMSIVVDPKGLNSSDKHAISVVGSDEKQLLSKFLEELLFLLDSKFFLLKEIRSMQISQAPGGFSLEAVVVGQKASPKIQTHVHVKAVTYNEMEILRTEKGVTIQVVLDL